MNLKELRLQANMKQSDIAELLKTNVPLISNYENGISLPDLENCAILENYFGEAIDWSESITPLKKHETIQSIIELMEHYPIEVVAEFLGRNYRRNQTPETYISHYANRLEISEEPMLPNS